MLQCVASKKKNDRLEFSAQEKIALKIEEFGENWKKFMKAYFDATGIIYRFSRTMLKRFREQINVKISDQLLVELDEDFALRGDKIIITSNKELIFQNILRAFYYRGKYDASFDEYLRSMIIDVVNSIEEKSEHVQISSVFFREILNLEGNVGKTLTAMSELGVLQLYLPEFRDLIGFVDETKKQKLNILIEVKKNYKKPVKKEIKKPKHKSLWDVIFELKLPYHVIRRLASSYSTKTARRADRFAKTR